MWSGVNYPLANCTYKTPKGKERIKMKRLSGIITVENVIQNIRLLKVLSAISLFIVLSLLPIQTQAYFGLPYNMFGFPYYGFGIGTPYYAGLFGSSYVTAPPPDFSGWTWTSPTTAQYPYTLPGGVNAIVDVDWASGYEGQSPYYQQNIDLSPGYGLYGGLYGGYGSAGYGLYGGLYGGYGSAGYGLYGGLYGGYGAAGYGLYGGLSSPIWYDSFGGAWGA